MITNEVVKYAVEYMDSMRTPRQWASLEASIEENYCRVNAGVIHSDGTHETAFVTVRFVKDYLGIKSIYNFHN